MRRESAAWTAVGFAAALLMGAMAAPSSDVGRWQLRYDETAAFGGKETVLFDTATGSVWLLPPVGASDGSLEAKAARVRKLWVEAGPAR